MKIILSIMMTILISNAHAESKATPETFGDSAIQRVENCVCYKHIDAQNLKSWEIDWDDTEKLRKQISHCICKAHIDMQKVENPRRYIEPGAVLK